MVYQKKNGEIIERIRNTYAPYRVGETTSMGWKVLSIKYNYKGKFYDRVNYDMLVTKKINRLKKNNKIKNSILDIYHKLSYFIILLFLIRVYEMLNTYIDKM